MNVDDSMQDVYIYETQQLLEALENTLFQGEEVKRLDQDQINEVFRITHTIKGSSAMMEYENMAKLSHSVEDVFSQIREFGAPEQEWEGIFDLTFRASSFYNGELAKLLDNKPMDGDPSQLIEQLEALLEHLKSGKPIPVVTEVKEDTKLSLDEKSEWSFVPNASEPAYKVKLFFEEDCQMESIRAFGVVQNLKKFCSTVTTVPKDLNTDTADEEIRNNGVCFYVQTQENPDQIKAELDGTLFVKNYSVIPMEEEEEASPADSEKEEHVPVKPSQEKLSAAPVPEQVNLESVAKQNFISVNVNKLDNLLNIVGEIVTAQSMVVNNADFGEREHDNFDFAAQQLHALINELQDIVMNIRMIPISTLFHKMRRLVRDMGKKFNKEIELELIGEETEVDKNVIDCLSDPLLHIIRNSVDHGIEDPQARLAAGKPEQGKITLEARMTGSDVIVTISDDGKGLQRDAILKKAYDKGLISKIDDDIPDKEVYSFIFLPGFSTKEQVTEYSGRGVGMDVVRKNISLIGGSIVLDSEPGKGTTHTIRIPLTLTIVNGLKFNVGAMSFIVPTVSVSSVVQPKSEQIFTDSGGNEIMMIQGECYPIIRLNQLFGIEGGVTELNEGMIMHITAEQRSYCIFFDELDSEYQVVVKALPSYLQHCSSCLDGIGGCAIMGDGSINLILDVNAL